MPPRRTSFRFGVGRADITRSVPSEPMLGFADEGQFSDGRVDLPLYARAFVIEENRDGGTRVALVVADIWSCGPLLKERVRELLNERPGAYQYDDATLVIGGTHTHSGIGGYHEYYLYSMTTQGYSEEVMNEMAQGIAAAVMSAEESLAPGRIFVGSGTIDGVGANRSHEAHLLNVDAIRNDPNAWVDREMLLLKFVRDLPQGGQQPVAMLNWHAVHPTGMGMNNQMISGDNKGWAERQFEEAMGDGFIAAFGNAAAGDVSGNVSFVDSPFGPRKVVRRPGGFTGDSRWHGDRNRMLANAERQSTQALAIFEAATEELRGPLTALHRRVDMSNVRVPGGRTWPAAVGFGFGGGSAEDSVARTLIGNSFIASMMREGFTSVDLVAGNLGVMSFLAGAFVTGFFIPIAVALTAGAAISAAGQSARQPITVVDASGRRTTRAVDPRPSEATPPTTVSPTFVAQFLTGALGLLAEPARTAFAGRMASIMFPGKVADEIPPNEFRLGLRNIAEGTLVFNMEVAADVYHQYADGHFPKPVMFAVGLPTVTLVPSDGSRLRVFSVPLVPHVIPLQLIRIGHVALACVPAEFTAQAGRRLKRVVADELSLRVERCAVFGYANAYAGYVTTPEEYDAQHYEGASTLYGRHTLAAYQQSFRELAARIVNPLLPSLRDAQPDALAIRVRTGVPRVPPTALSEWRVTAIRRRRGRVDSRISMIRAVNFTGARWDLTLDEALDQIDAGHSFFIEVPDGDPRRRVWVAEAPSGRRYLRTAGDSSNANNLSALPLIDDDPPSP